jgi:hypothetical protein
MDTAAFRSLVVDDQNASTVCDATPRNLTSGKSTAIQHTGGGNAVRIGPHTHTIACVTAIARTGAINTSRHGNAVEGSAGRTAITRGCSASTRRWIDALTLATACDTRTVEFASRRTEADRLRE